LETIKADNASEKLIVSGQRTYLLQGERGVEGGGKMKPALRGKNMKIERDYVTSEEIEKRGDAMRSINTFNNRGREKRGKGYKTGKSRKKEGDLFRSFLLGGKERRKRRGKKISFLGKERSGKIKTKRIRKK